MIPTTYLFVPGNRPERFAKALASGADRVIVDLEDAVAPADKALARIALGAWLTQLSSTERARVMVRINDALSPWHADDLSWLAGLPVAEVMLAKAETAEQIAEVRTHMSDHARVMPLVETVRGVMALPALTAAAGVSRLAFGAIDYQLDLDLPGPGLALDMAAVAIAMASRAADLPSPVAGVTTEIDATRVQVDLLHARSLGCSPLHILASPAYLARHGTPQQVQELAGHSLLGFTQTDTLNHWPLRHNEGDRLAIRPDLSASSGETLRQLAIAGEGIACLSHFMTHDDVQTGRLQVLLADATSGYRQPIHAVYYRNTQLALRIQCFLDFIQQKLAIYAC